MRTRKGMVLCNSIVFMLLSLLNKRYVCFSIYILSQNILRGKSLKRFYQNLILLFTVRVDSHGIYSQTWYSAAARLQGFG